MLLPPRTAILSACSLSKSFGDVQALKNVSFDVFPGELVGVLGENGAGKSTLFSLISGLNKPTSGTVTLLNRNPRLPETRRYIGVTPQGTGVDPRMKVRNFLNFVAFHFGTRSLVDEIMEKFRLTDHASKTIGNLSGGQQRLVSVASAFLADAPLTILDEPTTGLDTMTRSAIWESIKTITGENRALLVSSHYIEEIEQLCDRVIVLHKGNLIADSETKALLGSAQASIIKISDVPEGALSGEGSAFDILSANSTDTLLRTTDIKAALTSLAKDGWPFTQIEISHPSLEQAFITLSSEKEQR